MKRQWKIDHKANVGDVRIWKGDPNKLLCPWIKVNESKWMFPGESLDKGYHTIKKLTNLEWLEYVIAHRHAE